MSEQVDIEILGREFTVACSDEERDGLIASANYLNGKMQEIRDAGKVVNVERIAMMAALNITHELLNGQNAGATAHTDADADEMKRRVFAMQNQIDEVLTAQEKLL